MVELRAKIRVASTAKVRRRPMVSSSQIISRMSAGLKLAPSNKILIAIGASTGGTEAIIEVVKNLPATTPGIVIVRHMPANFTNMYAQRLNRICKMRAKEAADMDRVVQGQT